MANEIDRVSLLRANVPASMPPEGKCALAAADLERQGRIVQVVGRVVDGKVEIDAASLDRLATLYPGANMSFIALNAPFDPVRRTDNELARA